MAVPDWRPGLRRGVHMGIQAVGELDDAPAAEVAELRAADCGRYRH